MKKAKVAAAPMTSLTGPSCLRKFSNNDNFSAKISSLINNAQIHARIVSYSRYIAWNQKSTLFAK